MVDEEIEKAILFYMIFKNEEFDVTEEDFTNRENKNILKAIKGLKLKKEEVTMLTIKDKIDSKNNKILEYLSNLGQYIYKTNPETAYEILKNNTKKREVFKLSKEIQVRVKEEEEIDIYIEKIISKLQKIELQTKKEETFAELISRVAQKIEENINQKKDYDFYTGFFDLDSLTDGLHEGELTIIGARPRSWKNYIFITNSKQNS